MQGHVKPSLTVSGLRSKLMLSRKPKAKKRDPLEKRLLALLDTCLVWAEDTISERRIAKSALLKERNFMLGMKGAVSVATVHNHLHALTQLCGVQTLFEEDPKRQFSRFLPRAKEKLLQARQILLEAVQGIDPEHAARALNISEARFVS